ncbi:MAG TPA: hypothetical protein VL551_07485 [Actinospica sp.]|jgi:hypothetical protein|nr:hypothetical protein [Actinospica sp.]
MSSDENESPDGEPTGMFDAFRARQADERAQQAQQETQTAYSFPPEYAAAPEPVFYPTQPPAPPANRTRSVLIFVGAVLVAGVLGLGAWLAFGSSGTPVASAAAGTSASPSATSTGKRSALEFRVTIVSVGSDSFTGTVLATGQSVTVTLTDKTRFGTKARPFSKTGLQVGELVGVRGKRTGADTVTATVVTQAVQSSA